MIVEIEGFDSPLEFPDGTDSTVIQQTVKRLIAEKQPKPAETVLEKTIEPLTRAKDIYFQEEAEGRAAMKHMVEEPSGRNVLGGAVGALQWAFSPLTAFAKGFVGGPTESSLLQVGAPPKVAKFGGDLAENAAYFTPYGKAVQVATIGQKTLQQTKQAQNFLKRVAAETPKPKKPLKMPAGVSDDVAKDAVKPLTEAHKKSLQGQVVDDVVEQLKPVMKEKWQPHETKRITQELADYIINNPEEITKVATKYNLTPEQLGAQLKETMTSAGRDLNRMSRLAKEIRQQYATPYMRKLSDFLEQEVPELTTLDKFWGGWSKMENTRRSFLVGQLATAMRNAESQGARVALGTFDEALQGATKGFMESAGQGVIPSVKSSLRGLGEGLDLFVATANRFSPKGRKRLVELLDSANAVEAKAKTFASPVLDVTMTGNVSKLVNTVNRTQEYFFRNLAFEAKLRQITRNAGLDFNKLKPKDIPQKMYEEAADYALDITFAAMPKSKAGKELVKWASNPIFTTFVNPFPRFMFGNALPFLKRFSPAGFFDALRPQTMAQLASGDSTKFAKAASEATLGTLMLGTASYLRNSEHAGEKWYELKAGDKTIDTRAFAPFNTYLFMAEALNNPDNLQPVDFAQALVSLNRVAGTGLILADMIRGKDIATTQDKIEKFVGTYLGSFTVPLRTIKDLYSAVDEEEAIYRDIRENEFIGPTAQNIPGVSQTFPEARTPLQVGPMKAETPALRQFTGLSMRTKTEIQKEVDRIKLSYQSVFPGTGVPEADRRMSELMAPYIEKLYPAMVENTNYPNLDKTTQRLVLAGVFKEAKAEARKVLQQENPELAAKVKWEQQPKDIIDLLKSRMQQ